MSFKLFIYYCAVCGGWAALAGWSLGSLFAAGVRGELAQDVLMGLFLGLAVATALGVTDALWSLPGGRHVEVVRRGLLIGLVGGGGGLAGALLGGLLWARTHNTLFQLVGWTFVGLLIGVSVGLYDLAARLRAGDGPSGAARKLRHGALGGAVGGLAGAILFVALRSLIGALLRRPAEDLVSASAVGFVALGACIGLFIGLAQVIFKEAWIKVEVGRRAGREMILSRDETSIGRAEACDVGLFGDPGVERLHARILHQDHLYLLADAGTPGGTYLNDRRVGHPTPLRSGDAIRVGACVLRFRERHQRQPSGVHERLLAPPPLPAS
jgi:hypothetical protein